MKLLKIPVRLLAGSTAVALAYSGAAAQPGVTIQSTDPADRLTANLVELSRNPRDLDALIGAGESALAIGDGNAALGFFAKADAIEPSNGRVKLGLAGAFNMLGRPADALQLLSEAESLGLSEGQLAGERGLAYDMRGDSRRAQREYRTALKSRADDELTRRLALSLGIAGDRDEALEMLDPLLRRQDMSAWRARAFILAMAGNLDAAEQTVRNTMPGSTGAAMVPFLRRLPGLNAAERAMAVNFGIMPTGGQSLASVELGDPYRPAGRGDGLIPVEDKPAARPEDTKVAMAPPPVSREPRRRPGRDAAKSSAEAASPQPSPGFGNGQTATAQGVQVSSTRRVGERIGPVDPARLPPELRGDGVPPPVKVTLLPGVKELPKPAGPAPLPAASETGGTAAQKPMQATPAPRFEIPASPPPPPSPVAVAPPPSPPPVVVAPPPPPPSPQPVSIAVAPPPPPSVVVTPPPPPPVVVTPPSAPPVQTAIVPTPPPAAPAPNPLAVASGDAEAKASQVAAASVPAPAGRPALLGPPTEPVAAGASPPSAADELKPEPRDITQVAAAEPAPQPAAAEERNLAQIVAGLELEAESAAVALPDERAIRAARLAQQRKEAAEAKEKAEAEAKAKAEREEREAKEREAKRHPARIWVQVATGSNTAGLPGTWRKLKAQAPKSLGARSGWWTPFRGTNRLLVGPVRSAGEARALVASLAGEGISAFAFSSEAGQEIKSLGGG